MKRLNEMFHVENDQLIKTSNGEPVPEDEPIFILRGRDRMAINALTQYRWCCQDCGVPGDRIDALDEVIAKFRAFRSTHYTKLPGITHGK